MIQQHPVQMNGVQYAYRSVAAEDVLHRLQGLAAEPAAALRAYRGLTKEIKDPTADVVIGLITRETELHRTLLERILIGALDSVDSAKPATAQCSMVDAPRTTATLHALSQDARSHAQQLKDLACSERGLDRWPRAMLLDAMAADSDKHARLLAELGRHLERMEHKRLWGSRDV